MAQVHFKLLQTTCNTASNINAVRTVIRLCYLGNDKNTNLYMLSNRHPLEKKKKKILGTHRWLRPCGGRDAMADSERHRLPRWPPEKTAGAAGARCLPQLHEDLGKQSTDQPRVSLWAHKHTWRISLLVKCPVLFLGTGAGVGRVQPVDP